MPIVSEDFKLAEDIAYSGHAVRDESHKRGIESLLRTAFRIRNRMQWHFKIPVYFFFFRFVSRILLTDWTRASSLAMPI